MIQANRPAPPPGAGPSAAGGQRALLTLRAVTVTANEDGRTLLRVPSLDVHPGERIVITGPSGSGKSLLLSTFTGRWPVGVRFAGERTASMSTIGFVPQRGLDALHPLLPLGRQLSRVSRSSPDHVRRVLESVGLVDPSLARRRPTELSGGQAQRAAVALAALTESPLILADEPTSALDHVSRELMLQLLLTTAGDSQTLIVTTHDPVVARSLAARHIRVVAGEISEEAAEAHEQKAHR